MPSDYLLDTHVSHITEIILDHAPTPDAKLAACLRVRQAKKLTHEQPHQLLVAVSEMLLVGVKYGKWPWSEV